MKYFSRCICVLVVLNAVLAGIYASVLTIDRGTTHGYWASNGNMTGAVYCDSSHAVLGLTNHTKNAKVGHLFSVSVTESGRITMQVADVKTGKVYAIDMVEFAEVWNEVQSIEGLRGE